MTWLVMTAVAMVSFGVVVTWIMVVWTIWCYWRCSGSDNDGRDVIAAATAMVAVANCQSFFIRRLLLLLLRHDYIGDGSGRE